jgi:UDP-N-acetylmuramyl pentapeptide phosphotransferase/UDP-N-acetylglucosamine-1-phosphate transferase
MALAIPIAISLIAFAAAWAATRALIPVLWRNGCIAIPNERSSHTRPTPDGGGIGIVAGLSAGIGLAWLLGCPIPSGSLLLGTLMIAVVGLIDDQLGGVPVLWRLLVQTVAAVIVVHGAGGFERLPLPEPLDLPLGSSRAVLAMFWIVAVTNVYNFLDGIDGFAALQAVILGLAVAALDPAGSGLALGLAMAGASGGFLCHNWHPAKVFMGDVGATTLGFLAAAMPLEMPPGARERAVFLVAMCLWFFLADGLYTLVRRLFRREDVFAAHRSHLYQRLVCTGLRHDQVTLAILGPAIVLSLAALMAERTGAAAARWMVLGAAMVMLVAYIAWVAGRERRVQRWAAASRPLDTTRPSLPHWTSPVAASPQEVDRESQAK